MDFWQFQMYKTSVIAKSNNSNYPFQCKLQVILAGKVKLGWNQSKKKIFLKKSTFTSSKSPSLLTTVSVFPDLLSSKCGGEYPGALAGILVEWSASLIIGLTSTSGDSNSVFLSSIVLCNKRFLSWEDSSLERWALSSTESLVMEDLEKNDKNFVKLIKKCHFWDNSTNFSGAKKFF